MPDYTVRTSCEVAGIWREKGETITLSAAAAMHLVPPFGGVLVLSASSAPAASIGTVMAPHHFDAVPETKKGRRRARLERR